MHCGLTLSNQPAQWGTLCCAAVSNGVRRRAMRWHEYVWYRQLGQLLRLSLVALPLSLVLNRAAYRFVNPAFIGWMDYYTWPELCLSNPGVVLIAICFWRVLRVLISIAARTKGQLSNPQSSGRVRFWPLDIGRLFLQCVSVCMATAVPLLLAWVGTYRHYFHTGPYPAMPILISWIAGGVTWWLLDRRIAPCPPGRGVSLFPRSVT